MSGENSEGQLFDYTYPDHYTYDLSGIIIEEYKGEKGEIHQILEEVGKGYDSFCKGLGFEELTEELLETEGIYGFLYKIDKTKELVGFALFFVNEIPKGKSITLKGKEYPEGTTFIEGLQRCSKIKGIGRAIQSNIEDFAKQNNIQIIKIQSITQKQGKEYYKEKFEYVKSNCNKSELSCNLYKVVEGGRRKRRTVRRKKVSKKTRKSKE